MPNRDYEDSPYNRSEGRFESRDDRDEYRGERRGDWGRSEYDRGSYDRGYSRGNYGPSSYVASGSYTSGYNPSRDDYEYRGGSRYEGAHPEDRRYDRNFSNDRGLSSRFEDERRFREQLRGGGQGSGYGGGYGGGYGSGYGGGYGSNFGGQRESMRRDWERGNDWDRGNDWGHDYRSRSPYGSPSSATGYDYDRSGSRGTTRGYRDDHRSHDDRDWGDQLREAGQQMIGKVKRAFRGPKGYKRSDDRIREDVSDRLGQQDELDPSEIEVQVQNGEVTLTGTVRYRFEKFRAEELADDVSGVSDVHNQLRIAQPQTQQFSTSSQQGSVSAGTSSPNGTLGSTQSTTRNGRV